MKSVVLLSGDRGLRWRLEGMAVGGNLDVPGVEVYDAAEKGCQRFGG